MNISFWKMNKGWKSLLHLVGKMPKRPLQQQKVITLYILGFVIIQNDLNLSSNSRWVMIFIKREFRTDTTLHELYLQLRLDTLASTLKPNRDKTFELGALALQAEYSDRRDNNAQYFQVDNYLPKVRHWFMLAK